MDRKKLAWLALGVAVSVHCGCASFMGAGVSKHASAGDPGQRYRVEMSNMFGIPRVFEGQLEPNMTVQHALEKSGATRRYRNMEINILRIVEGTGQPLNLAVQYHPAKKMVAPEQDYAILPGDRIIVEPASSLLGKLSNPN